MDKYIREYRHLMYKKLQVENTRGLLGKVRQSQLECLDGSIRELFNEFVQFLALCKVESPHSVAKGLLGHPDSPTSKLDMESALNSLGTLFILGTITHDTSKATGEAVQAEPKEKKHE